VSGQPSFVGGTSASTPIFASIINLINEKRLGAGKSTVGFINPTLYKNPHAFTDVNFLLLWSILSLTRPDHHRKQPGLQYKWI